MSIKAISIIGGGTGINKRQPLDYYPTLEYVTEVLFKEEQFKGDVLECASGDGAMSKIIEQYNTCISSDIRTDNIAGTGGIDFLTQPIEIVDNIITNPPYSHANEFVLKAKEVAKYKIAMILKLDFMGGVWRGDNLFPDKEFPIKSILVFSKRIQFSPKGSKAGSPTMTHAWFIWDKAHEGKPNVAWIYENEPKLF